MGINLAQEAIQFPMARDPIELMGFGLWGVGFFLVPTAGLLFNIGHRRTGWGRRLRRHLWSHFHCRRRGLCRDGLAAARLLEIETIGGIPEQRAGGE